MLLERAQALGEQPEDPLLLLSVLHGFWVANHVAFNGDLVRNLAVEFMTIAEKQGTTFPLVLGHRVMGTSLLFLGRHRGKPRAPRSGNVTLQSRRALPAGDAIWPRKLVWQSSQIGRWPYGFWAIQTLLSKKRTKRLDYARDIGQTASFLYGVTRIAWFQLVVGNYTKAAGLIQQLMTIAEEMEGSYWTAAGMMLQGCLFAFTGKGSTAI